MLEINKIYCGDCLELMKQIPDKSIDLVLTDPPYGDDIGYGRMGKEIENNEDESINYKALPIIWDKLKEGGVCYLFTNWKFSCKIRAFLSEQTHFNIRMQLVIVKNNIGMGYGFRNQYELCLVLEKGGCKYNLNDFSNVIKMEHIQHDKDTHPHEKGHDMIKKMILHTTKEGDLVLDPFLGSGTTAVACKQLKRNFIGIEISQKYCDIANQRLRQDILLCMTSEQIKDQRVEFIEKIIYKYTTEEPKLSLAEIAYAVMFHLDSEEFLKAVKKENKSK